MIKKAFYLLVSLNCFLSLQPKANSDVSKMQTIDNPLKISYHKDSFGNICIEAKKLKSSDFIKNLEFFLQEKKHKLKSKSFLVEVPRKFSALSPKLKELGFQLHHTNTEKEIWIIINGSPMPEALTCVGGAFTLIFNTDGNVLIIADRYKKQKIEGEDYYRTILPGGSIKGNYPFWPLYAKHRKKGA